MRIVDAHCHLACEEFEDTLEDVIEEARTAGVVKMVTSGVTPEDWDETRDMTRRFAEVEFAWGIHPWFVPLGEDGPAREELDRAYARLRTARDHGAVAVGEIGLDKRIDAPTMEDQVGVFEEQLAIADELGLPVVVHCRGAFNEVLHVLRATRPLERGGLVHAFSGSLEVAEEFMRLGFSFSLGRSLTYRNSRKRETVLRKIYPDRFLLETDSPDMPPVEVKDGVNVPANIRFNLRAAAEILGESEERVAETTTANAARLFGLDV